MCPLCTGTRVTAARIPQSWLVFQLTSSAFKLVVVAAFQLMPRLVVGTVCSGDRWNRTPASIERLVARHDSYCEDMEAAALALVCLSHDVPFLRSAGITRWLRLDREAGLAEIDPL